MLTNVWNKFLKFVKNLQSLHWQRNDVKSAVLSRRTPSQHDTHQEPSPKAIKASRSSSASRKVKVSKKHPAEYLTNECTSCWSCEKLFASCFYLAYALTRRLSVLFASRDCRDYDDHNFFSQQCFLCDSHNPLSIHLHVAFIIRQAIIVKIFAGFTIRSMVFSFRFSSILEKILFGKQHALTAGKMRRKKGEKRH